jgi:hypothetical protein
LEKKTPAKYKHGVTWRAIIIGLLLTPFNSYWVFLTEVVRYQGHPTTISLFYNVIFNLIILLLLNHALKRYIPKWALSQGELLTIYVMLNISSALIGHDQIQVLIPMLTHPFYFATPENNWESMFHRFIPEWLSVRDPAALKAFYQGSSSLYMHQNWSAWLVPVLAWSAFIIAMLGVFLCMNVLLRKQWTEREKLTYPLVQLPIDMTAENTPLFKDWLLWCGFAVAAAIGIINGLNLLHPSIPHIPIKLEDQSHVFTTRPWNNIGWLPINFYPFAIGLGILLPLDLSFSCWFFFIFWKAQRIISAVYGWETIPGFPYTNEQSFGAYMGIFVFAFWVSRKHLKNIVLHFIGKQTEIDDTGEAISYRAATLGVLLGVLFLFAFALAIGLSIWLTIAFFALFFAMTLAITRMRAELGPPAHDLHDAGPDKILATVLGPQNLGTKNLTALTGFFWFNRAYRSHPMPFQLEGMKMAERTKMNYRMLFVAILLAGIAGTIAAFWVSLHSLYQLGAAAKIGPPNVMLIFGTEPYNRLDYWMKGSPVEPGNLMIAMGIGFTLTVILQSCRMRLPWFPFHPVGYAVSSSWSMHRLWLGMLIAWCIKLLLLRYGGLRLYRRAIPFFLGIILGECVIGSLWTIIGIALDVPSYAFWP